jgi:hypothetical protein
VYEILEGMKSRGIITWTLEIAVQRYPEKNLKEKLMKIGDDQLRGRALAVVDELIERKQEVNDSAGDSRRLDLAISRLEESFSRATGKESTRSAGKMYAGRTLVYEDCRRNIDVKLGRKVVSEVGDVLGLILDSARWFTYQVGKRHEKLFKEVYEEMAAQSNSRVINAVKYSQKVEMMMTADNPHLVLPVFNDFQDKWAEILRIPEGERRVNYDSKVLEQKIRTHFYAPRPGWILSRYQSPDVMIAVSNSKDASQDDYLYVLGEMHMGTHTMRGSCFLSQHPSPEQLFEAVDWDMPEPHLFPVPPKFAPKLNSRTHAELVSSKNYRLVTARGTPAPPGTKELSISSLVVEDDGGGLIVRTRDGALRFGAVEAFSYPLASMVVNSFKMVRSGEHTPRVTIDRVVVHRESWSFAIEDADFAFEKDEAARFLQARKWNT